MNLAGSFIQPDTHLIRDPELGRAPFAVLIDLEIRNSAKLPPLLEHVPDPASVVQACAALVKPGGHVFFSTLNRNPKAYLLAIVGAEYVLNMVPRGTHDYAGLIKPSELAGMCRRAGLAVERMAGMTYNPFTRVYSLGSDTDVNYILNATKE